MIPATIAAAAITIYVKKPPREDRFYHSTTANTQGQHATRLAFQTFCLYHHKQKRAQNECARFCKIILITDPGNKC